MSGATSWVQLQALKVKYIEYLNSLCRLQIHNEDQDALRLVVMIGSALEESASSSMPISLLRRVKMAFLLSLSVATNTVSN